ncbi:uncharacterized protein LOC130904066 [Diorhabda carinulata]|uniref:uncharacterized protein LOC130904066 n=1 Tax=Diorhabda carinulata TaxID=1163345 RepID=UPI0025A0BB76|nr:uncharacterized protein LOC130904066 [Diorhabda carinulata]XP_057672582.1 uncharacterized protein LOC130904066 [Diorhabda carinulata]XP_057672583.1 uncharacterized protein LOC130904066 [Diorhabda carinulata]XP_057672584.1 uncharacterized protein LOC130904066 [Diorhabda carinulata]XP_057672585.1 uncharacterized protein LOC130904066 [Diorhabda carinulata]
MITRRLSRVNITKLVVCFIGTIHSILLYIGLTNTLRDAPHFEKDEKLENRENIEAIILYTGHFLIIFLLFFSVFKNAVRFLLPWLIVMLLPFTYMTFMVLIGLRDMKTYLIKQLLLNFIIIGICWLFWSILFQIYLNGDFKTVNFIDRGYNSVSSIFFLKRLKNFR